MSKPNDLKKPDPKLKELIDNYNRASKTYFAHHNAFIIKYRELAEYHDDANRSKLQNAVDSGVISSEIAKDLTDKSIHLWVAPEMVQKLEQFGVRLHSRDISRSFVKNLPEQSMAFFQEDVSNEVKTHALFLWMRKDKISFNEQDVYFFQPPQMLVGDYKAPTLLEGVDTRSAGFKSVIKPPEGLEHDEISNWISAKIKDPQYVTLYRVKTDRLLHNPWTPNLHELNKVFQFTDGSTIDGGSLENIEVAFFKVEK
ncbi:hypothetical protein [Bdellovibrio sp. BCCA]|uniref:hypothetical protein n=1 Tax=Bdellovibrio sp. BCCA TaxID=3136281 RepID=UPI0030F0492E